MTIEETMKFQIGHIYFSKIIVIQSLSEDERQTGTELHDDIISRRAWFDSSLTTKLFDVSTASDLETLLNTIILETSNNEYLPFIHFETHGSKDGIALKSGEIFPFSKLIICLREINLKSDNNLFISIGACWGGYIQFQTDISKPCPFRGFIGPMNLLFPSDIVVSFTAFFDELLLTNDFDKAINRLNLHNLAEIEFHHFASEAFYDIVLSNHRKQIEQDPLIRRKRVNSIVRELWMYNSNAKALFKTKGKLKKMVRKTEESEMDEIYEVMRNNFLHIKIKNSH